VLDHAVDPAAFVRAHTALAAPPLVPELRLHLASELTPLWEATEADLAATGLPPPYWAFAWPGGQALARHLLDRPGIVRGRSVLDFAAGSGIATIAAAIAGAHRVAATEIDRFARAAIALNAAANGVALELLAADLPGEAGEFEVVLAGDVCYERLMAEEAVSSLRRRAAGGALVLLGDPGRAYLPKGGLEALARYPVPTSLELEDRELRETTVYRVLPGISAGANPKR
jgi:predicted nicotinamide N-methyase